MDEIRVAILGGKGMLGSDLTLAARQQGFALGGVIGEVLQVPGVVRSRPGGQIGGCPDGERQTGQRPGGYRPARPYHNLAEVVGAGYPAE